MNKLVGSLVGTYSGPILVMGGAPGMPEELQWLHDNGFPKDAPTISANEHAIHAGVQPTYACVNDDIHSTLGVHQEPRLRKLMPNTKLLSRHWWADYRSPQLMPCNSGLKALLYAAILGANPIVVIGIQHYRNGLYFHAQEGNKKGNPNLARGESHFTKQTSQIKQKLGSIPVRTVSGPLTHIWPKWGKHEMFMPRQLGELELWAQDHATDTRYLYVRNAGYAFNTALVPQGMVFAVTRYELLERGRDEDVSDASNWDFDKMGEALEKDLEARRAEQVRLYDMIAKVRNSHRGVRRGLHDADLVRIIKWAEEGGTPETIEKRCSLPKQQISWLLHTMGLTTA